MGEQEEVEVNVSKYRLYTYLTAICLVCLTLVVIRHKWLLKWTRFGRRVDQIQGPFSVPILGTLALMFIPRTEILETLVRWANKFKGCFRLWVLNEPMIFISSPEYVQKILNSKEHVDKTGIYGVLSHLIGRGLITADTTSWRAHRKILINSVNGKMADVFLNINNEYLDIFQTVLENDPNIADADKTASSPTNLHPYINRLTLDVVSEAILGRSQNSLKNSTMKYLEAGIKNKEVCSKRWFNPWLRWNWLWSIHPLKKLEKDVVKVTRGYVQTAIKVRREVRHEMLTDNDTPNHLKRVSRGALIDTLLDAQQDSENEITDEYIQDELLTFLVAGHDTSAETVLWCLFLLGNNLEAQNKVHEELDGLFGDNKQPNFTMDDLQRMTYLEKCIKETLRMYPSVPLLQRKVLTDVVLEPDVVIPAGSDVCIPVPAVHHNPKVYPNPKKFDPERFSPENIEKRHSFAFCPFSLGPRNCIGKRFGEVATKAILARFFLNFSVVSSKKPEQVKTVAEVTLGPSKPIYFYVNRR